SSSGTPPWWVRRSSSWAGSFSVCSRSWAGSRTTCRTEPGSGREGGVLRLDRRVLVVLAVLTVLQVVVYYDHFAVALSLLFGLGIGLWLRHWSAAVLALASFVIAF